MIDLHLTITITITIISLPALALDLHLTALFQLEGRELGQQLNRGMKVGFLVGALLLLAL